MFKMVSEHVMIEVSTGRHICPSTWCSGTCGLPALVVHYKGYEYKAHGSQVACGPVFQSFRCKEWTGDKVEMDMSNTNVEDVLKRMWW